MKASVNIIAEGTQPSVRDRDGWLILAVCEEGGHRLVRRAGALQVQPRPLPADENLEIDVSVYERGAHELQLFDASGAVVFSETWVHHPGDALRRFHIDTRVLGTGTYQARVITPTRQRSATVLIVH